MYFWNINNLKKDISEHRLSETQIFYYVLVYVALSALGVELVKYFPAEEFNSWGLAESVLYVAIAIVGTIAAYRANGGAGGQGFAAKYFSVGLVVLIRFLPLAIFVVIAIVAYHGLTVDWSSPEVEESFDTGWLEVSLISVWYVAYYARVVKHIRDTAKA